MRYYFNINKNEKIHAGKLGLQWDKTLRCRYIDSDHPNFKEVMSVFGESSIDTQTAKHRKLMNPDNKTDHAKISVYNKYINRQIKISKEKSRRELEETKKKKRQHKKKKDNEKISFEIEVNENNNVLKKIIYLYPPTSKRELAISQGAKEEIILKEINKNVNGRIIKETVSVKSGKLYIWSNELNKLKSLIRFVPAAYFQSSGIDNIQKAEMRRINHKFRDIAIKLIGKNSTYDQRRITVANYYATMRFIP